MMGRWSCSSSFLRRLKRKKGYLMYAIGWMGWKVYGYGRVENGKVREDRECSANEKKRAVREE